MLILYLELRILNVIAYEIVLISQVILILDSKKICVITIMAKKCVLKVWNSLSKIDLGTDVPRVIFGIPPYSFIKIHGVYRETTTLWEIQRAS